MMLAASTPRPAGLLPARSSSCRCFAAHPTEPRRPAGLRRVAAEAGTEDTPVAPKAGSLFSSGSGKITGSLAFTEDKETFQDVFAFAGELPERLNGRLAMWAFAAIMLAEAQSGGAASVLSQTTAHPIGATSFSFTIILASLAPKFASGNSLKVLHESASRDQLPKVLAFFNKTHELWLGRVAMIGIVGTAVLEAVKGSPLIGG